MNKLRSSFWFVGVLGMLFMAGCSFSPVLDRNDVDDGSEMNLEAEGENDENEMALPEALSDDEIAKYKADLQLEVRVELAAELASKMPLNGMDQMRTMFPDLIVTGTTENEDPLNMLHMGEEDWVYSEEGDITVVVCRMANAPIQILKGRNPSDEDVQKAMEMMEITRKNMEKDGDIEAAENGEGAKIVMFSQELYEKTLGERPFAIYFHANWCPVCFALEENMKKNLSSLPDGGLILQVDYDNADELKQTYGVSQQATIVFLDSRGDVVGTELNPSISRIAQLIENSKN